MSAIYTVWFRSVLKYVRSKSRIIGSLGMPFFFLVIMGFGLNRTVQSPITGVNYIDFIAAGIVSMSVLFASMFSGVQLVIDKQFGFLKETLVAPVSRLQLMIGQTLGGATTAMLQGLLVFFISFLVGVKMPGIGGILIGMGFMFLIGIAFTAVGISFASRMEDTQGFQLIVNFIIFPLFFLSGALFPLEGLPNWLLFFTRLDPLTYGVEGVRYSMLGSSQIPPMTSFAVLGSFAAAMILVGAFLFRKIKL